jgi:hypothetical protein
VRLIENAPADSRYAAPSYCWGANGSLVTTQASFQERKRKIPWSDLPRTFQDAITFAQYLQLKYIWIDSLCILQDCEEDWENESSKMASIYERAFVVLSASRSMDVHSGLWTDALSSFRQRHRLTFRNASGHDISVYAYAKHLVCQGSEGWIGKSMLRSRAWAFQERLLGTRNIHFSFHDLKFECRSGHECECGTSSTAQYDNYELDNLLSEFHELGSNSEAASHLWQRVVECYSDRQLTKTSDKLPALSGVARQMEQAFGGNYLAGLWLKDLPKLLLWQFVGNMRDVSRLGRIAQPSW